MNGQLPDAYAPVSPTAQYNDGPSLYQFTASNPNTHTDPTGLSMWDFDYFTVSGAIVDDIVGERTAHLTQLNQWLARSVNVASVLGHMAFTMLPGADAVILAGKLAAGKDISFEDILNAGLSIGGAAIVGKMIGKLAFAKKAYKARRVARTASNVPRSLLRGPKDVHVYLAYRKGKPVYVGVSKNIAQRTRQHGIRFEKLDTITSEPLTRRQARAIEQVLYEGNPQFENMRNPIDPLHDWYGDAVEWGEAWLRENGFF